MRPNMEQKETTKVEFGTLDKGDNFIYNHLTFEKLWSDIGMCLDNYPYDLFRSVWIPYYPVKIAKHIKVKKLTKTETE